MAFKLSSGPISIEYKEDLLTADLAQKYLESIKEVVKFLQARAALKEALDQMPKTGALYVALDLKKLADGDEEGCVDNLKMIEKKLRAFAKAADDGPAEDKEEGAKPKRGKKK